MTRNNPSPAPATKTGLADALFTKTQQRVLGLLFGQSERGFPVTEVIAQAGSGSGGVQRELARLASAGLLTLRQQGRQRLYQANHESPIFIELSRIVRKTIAFAEPIARSLRPFKANIDAAFIFGSVAKRSDSASSDIDLFVVGDGLSYAELMSALEKPAKLLGRAINPSIYTLAELHKRIETDNAFVRRVLQQEKQWLFGNEAALMASDQDPGQPSAATHLTTDTGA